MSSFICNCPTPCELVFDYQSRQFNYRCRVNKDNMGDAYPIPRFDNDRIKRALQAFITMEEKDKNIIYQELEKLDATIDSKLLDIGL